MKKIIFILTLLLLVIFLKDSWAIDTVSTKYLPLQVGNVWVYNYSGNFSGKERLKIISTTVQNGHRYYNFSVEVFGTTCECGIITYTPFLVQLQPLRIDSVNGNLLMLGNSCLYVNEHLIDSLASRLNCSYPDTPLNYCNQTRCCDTGNQSKTFGNYGVNWSYDRTYRLNIGLYQSWQGCFGMYSCNYNLQGCVINGILWGDTGYPTGIIKTSSEVPKEFSLYQNYPNPFNPSTNIKYQIAKNSNVTLKIYDILGNDVATLVNEKLSPGTYEVEWNGSNYSNCVYFYILTAGEFSETKKLILLK